MGKAAAAGAAGACVAPAAADLPRPPETTRAAELALCHECGVHDAAAHARCSECKDEAEFEAAMEVHRARNAAILALLVCGSRTWFLINHGFMALVCFSMLYA